MLAHINPQEAALLKAHGGSGAINPRTGLPEFKKFYQQAAKLNPFSYSNDVGGNIVGAVDDFKGSVANKLDDLGPYAPLVMGALLGPAGLQMSAMGAGLTVGATYGIANGSLKSGLRAGLSAGSGANIAGGIANLSSGSSAGAGGVPKGNFTNLQGTASSTVGAPPVGAPPVGAEAGSFANLQGTATAPPVTPMPAVAPPAPPVAPPPPSAFSTATQGLQNIYTKAANSEFIQGAENMYDKALNSQFVQGSKELVTTPGAPSALIEKTGYMPYTALAAPYLEEQVKKAKDSQTEQQNAILAKAEEAKIGEIRDFTYDPKTQAFTSAGTRRVKYGPNETRKFTYDPVSGKYTRAADGGIMGMGSGGISDLGSYSDGGRMLRGPGDGVSDSIPAMIGGKQPARLADGEFVVPARIVSELGNGSSEAGARKLYAMMDRIQKARGKTTGKDAVAKNSRAEKHLPA
jgi:hypothetical protein